MISIALICPQLMNRLRSVTSPSDIVIIPDVKCEFQTIFWTFSFGASMNQLNYPPVMLNFRVRYWLAFFRNLIFVAVELSITFSMLACPRVLAKVAAGLSGFSTVVMVTRSCCN